MSSDLEEDNRDLRNQHILCQKKAVVIQLHSVVHRYGPGDVRFSDSSREVRNLHFHVKNNHVKNFGN